MPALPNVPNVLKAVVAFTINNIPCVNIFHIKYAGNPPFAADCNTIAALVHTQWSQNFNTNTTPATVLQSTTVQDLTSPTANQGIKVQAIPGTASGVTLSAQASIVGSWQIANRYRGGKPRTYISGLAQATLLDPQHFTTAFVSTITNSFTGFMNNINVATAPSGVTPLTLGCVHYRKGNVALAVPTFDAFTGVKVLSNVRSQRGRLT